ncbi:MAG: DUF1080 domain-containing protein [Phycisphaerae bacterium]|nr:DUF1080 domain-containing protein [Phycisphaerae bacterium]
MTRRPKLTPAIACGFVCMWVSASLGADVSSSVATLIAKMPAQNVAQENGLCAELIKLGAPGVADVCNRLVPPGKGDDTKARYALSGLARYVGRPGADAERRTVADAIADALKSAADDEVKAFLIRRLQLVGQETHLAQLSAFLTDKRLCEPATQAMLAIGGPKVSPLLLDALPKTPPENRVTVIKAMGDLRSEAAAAAIMPYATDQDAKVRMAALYALANMGCPSAVDVLAKAAQTTLRHERAEATSYYLLLARQIARKDPARCANLCRELIKTRTAADDANVRSAALSALVGATGEQALDDLLAKMDGQDAQLQASALALASNIPGQAATAKWIDKAKAVSPPARARIVAMLGLRGDAAARATVLDALKDKDQAVRLSAVPAAIQLCGKDALSPLLAMLASATPDDVQAVRQGLLCMPGDGIPDAVAAALPNAPWTAKVALIDVLAARAAAKYLPVVYAQAGDAQRDVRLAVIRAMVPLCSDQDLPKAVALLVSAKDAAERAEAEKTLVTLATHGATTKITSDDVVAALEKALPQIKDTTLRNQTKAYLDKLPKPDKFNLARGKPVQTSVPHQGDRTPDKAVDGNDTDNNAAWFGAKWPSWLQVDLGKPVKIDTIHVIFYWDGRRYYQYNLQVSLDGKSFKTVVDMAQNVHVATPSGVIHTFAPTEARYVRVNVLKNSVNEAVHLVELKVYAEGAGPKPPPPPKPDAEGFIPVFNGKDLSGWIGHTAGYHVENGILVGGSTIFLEKEYGDFVFRFDFKLTPGANSGVSVRSPLQGTSAYVGMEIQILDDTADCYKNIKPYQRHGSIYGIVPAKTGHLKPVGEWNSEEITANGRHVTVKLNGVTIVDADIDKASTPKTIDGNSHPGLKRTKGYLGFCGHGSRVEFRNIKVKELK